MKKIHLILGLIFGFIFILLSSCEENPQAVVIEKKDTIIVLDIKKIAFIEFNLDEVKTLVAESGTGGNSEYAGTLKYKYTFNSYDDIIKPSKLDSINIRIGEIMPKSIRINKNFDFNSYNLVVYDAAEYYGGPNDRGTTSYSYNLNFKNIKFIKKDSLNYEFIAQGNNIYNYIDYLYYTYETRYNPQKPNEYSSYTLQKVKSITSIPNTSKLWVKIKLK